MATFTQSDANLRDAQNLLRGLAWETEGEGRRIIGRAMYYIWQRHLEMRIWNE